MALSDYAGAYGRPTSVKAILRDSKGFTQERTVKFPPPPIIKFAKASMPAVYVADCETLPEPIFETVEFKYVSITSMPSADNGVKYIANYEEVPAVPNWADQDLLAVIKAHQSKHGYSKLIEASMVSIGNNNPAFDHETPFEYLDRLLSMAKEKEKQQVIEYQYQNKLTTQAQQQYQQQQYQYAAWSPYQPWYLQNDQYMTNTPGHMPWISAAPAMPAILPIQASPAPEPEKPKAELPEPIEPKKRFMKKA